MPRHSIPKPRFVLNIPKGKQEGYVRLEYRHQPGKAPVKINTGFKSTLKDWDKNAMRFVERSERDLINNGTLSRIGNAAKKVFMQHGSEISKQDFKELIEIELGWAEAEEVETIPTLSQYVANAVKRRSEQPGENPGTIKNLKKIRNQVAEFCEWLKRDIDFDEINLETLERIKYWGYKEKGWNKNTLRRFIKYLKQFLNAANAEGLHQNMIHRSSAFRIKSAPSTHVVTYLEDLERFASFPLTDESEIKIRDIYLIGCLTLMRISDFKRINQDCIEVRNGSEYIRVITQKTKTQVLIPLFPLLKDILKKYDYNPPMFVDQYFNRAIKKLLKKCGFTQLVEVINTKGGENKSEYLPFYSLVSAHTTRRSGATILYLAGVPTPTIRRLTGHKSDAQLMQYIIIGDKQAAKQMEAVYRSLKAVK